MKSRKNSPLDTRPRIFLREAGTDSTPLPGIALPENRWTHIVLVRETDTAFFGVPAHEPKIEPLEFPKYAWERVP